MPDYEVIQLESGWQGTDLTVQKILDIVDQALTRPIVVLTARRIVQYVPERDKDAEIAAVSAFVREKVHYVNEGIETLTAPWIMLKEIQQRGNFPGDCDESVLLWLALLKSLGFKTRIDVISQRADKRANHIYGEVFSPSRGWTTDDSIVKDKPLGWKPHAEAGVTRRKVYGDLLAMSGLSGDGPMYDESLDGLGKRRKRRGFGGIFKRSKGIFGRIMKAGVLPHTLITSSMKKKKKQKGVKSLLAGLEAYRLRRREMLQTRVARTLPPDVTCGVRRVPSDRFARPKELWSQRVATPAIAWKHWRGMDLATDEHGTVEGILPNIREITGKIVQSVTKRAKSFAEGTRETVSAASSAAAQRSSALPLIAAAAAAIFIVPRLLK